MIGCCARWREIRRTSRSCTASRASAAFRNSKSTGSQGTRARGRCASAMRRSRSCSSTSTARSWTRSTRPAAPGSPPTSGPGASSGRCCSGSTTLWREPDEGIWEVRGPRRHFTHSKVLAWVAFDRGVKSVEQQRQHGPVDAWRRTRRRHPRRRLPARVRSVDRGVHAGLWLAGARRQHAHAAARRLRAGVGSARGRHRRGHRTLPGP